MIVSLVTCTFLEQYALTTGSAHLCDANCAPPKSMPPLSAMTALMISSVGLVYEYRKEKEKEGRFVLGRRSFEAKV
jgi:hypothetical protein